MKYIYTAYRARFYVSDMC